jgi:hypothetical protein
MATSAACTGVRPGLNGAPGCAYVMAPGLEQRRVDDYCNCGGTVASLITERVDDHVSRHFGYCTQPNWNRCPGNPTASSTPAPAATPMPTPSPGYAKGTCRMHIHEYTLNISLQLDVFMFDANSVRQYIQRWDPYYSSNVVLRRRNTPFDYDIRIDVHFPPISMDVNLGDSAALYLTFGMWPRWTMA